MPRAALREQLDAMSRALGDLQSQDVFQQGDEDHDDDNEHDHAGAGARGIEEIGTGAGVSDEAGAAARAARARTVFAVAAAVDADVEGVHRPPPTGAEDDAEVLIFFPHTPPKIVIGRGLRASNNVPPYA